MESKIGNQFTGVPADSKKAAQDIRHEEIKAMGDKLVSQKGDMGYFKGDSQPVQSSGGKRPGTKKIIPNDGSSTKSDSTKGSFSSVGTVESELDSHRDIISNGFTAVMEAVGNSLISVIPAIQTLEQEINDNELEQAHSRGKVRALESALDDKKLSLDDHKQSVTENTKAIADTCSVLVEDVSKQLTTFKTELASSESGASGLTDQNEKLYQEVNKLGQSLAEVSRDLKKAKEDINTAESAHDLAKTSLSTYQAASVVIKFFRAIKGFFQGLFGVRTKEQELSENFSATQQQLTEAKDVESKLEVKSKEMDASLKGSKLNLAKFERELTQLNEDISKLEEKIKGHEELRSMLPAEGGALKADVSLDGKFAMKFSGVIGASLKQLATLIGQAKGLNDALESANSEYKKAEAELSNAESALKLVSDKIATQAGQKDAVIAKLTPLFQNAASLEEIFTDSDDLNLLVDRMTTLGFAAWSQTPEARKFIQDHFLNLGAVDQGMALKVEFVNVLKHQKFSHEFSTKCLEAILAGSAPKIVPQKQSQPNLKVVENHGKLNQQSENLKGDYKFNSPILEKIKNNLLDQIKKTDVGRKQEQLNELSGDQEYEGTLDRLQGLDALLKSSDSLKGQLTEQLKGLPLRKQAKIEQRKKAIETFKKMELHSQLERLKKVDENALSEAESKLINTLADGIHKKISGLLTPLLGEIATNTVRKDVEALSHITEKIVKSVATKFAPQVFVNKADASKELNAKGLTGFAKALGLDNDALVMLNNILHYLGKKLNS